VSNTAIGINITNRILSGALNSTTLQTELGTTSNLVAFKKAIGIYDIARELFEDSASLAIIKGSALAWSAIKNNSVALSSAVNSIIACKNLVSTSAIIQDVVTDLNFFYAFKDSKWKNLKQHVNQSYSKLKRVIYKASGNFIPSANIAKWSACLIGGGGGGGQNNSANDNQGGGGGAFYVLSGSTLTSGTTYPIVIGSGGLAVGTGGATTFNGSSAPGGDVGYNGGSGTGAGGGTTTLNGIADLSDLDIENAIWQFFDFQQKGATGGILPTFRGKSTILGRGGFTYRENGAGYISGGASGASVFTTAQSGLSADDNTGCGGGGGDSDTSTLGGIGGSGLFILHFIEA